MTVDLLSESHSDDSYLSLLNDEEEIDLESALRHQLSDLTSKVKNMSNIVCGFVPRHAFYSIDKSIMKCLRLVVRLIPQVKSKDNAHHWLTLAQAVEKIISLLIEGAFDFDYNRDICSALRNKLSPRLQWWFDRYCRSVNSHSYGHPLKPFVQFCRLMAKFNQQNSDGHSNKVASAGEFCLTDYQQCEKFKLTTEEKNIRRDIVCNNLQCSKTLVNIEQKNDNLMKSHRYEQHDMSYDETREMFDCKTNERHLALCSNYQMSFGDAQSNWSEIL